MIEHVHLHEESREPQVELPSDLEHKAGYYYVEVRVVLFREHEGRILAQLKPFFFRRRPVVIGPESPGQVTFPVAWPEIPLEELRHYRTFSPKKPDQD